MALANVSDSTWADAQVEAAVDAMISEAAAAERLDAVAAVFPTLDYGILVVASNGKLVAVNRAAEVLMGRNPTELQDSLRRSDRLPVIRPDGSPWVFEQRPPYIAMRTRTAVRNAIMGLFRPDGSLVWLSISALPVQLASGPGVAVTLSDVTETFTDRQRFRMLFDHSAVAGWIIDATDYTITAVNDRLLHWLGYSRSELVGGSHLRFVHPADHGRVRAIRDEISRWEHRREDLRFVHADGSVVWGVAEAIAITDPATGHLSRLVQAFDSTDHVAALAKSNDSNRRFRVMFERSLSPSIVVDLAVHSGRVVAANRAFGEFCGFEPDTLAMALLAELVHPDDRPQLHAALDALALDVIEEATIPARIKTASGDLVLTQLEVVAIASPDGSVTSAIVQVGALAGRIGRQRELRRWDFT